MKIKLFTHTDLDGVGCAVVAKTAFKDVDVEYCDYVDVNEKIALFLKSDDLFSYDRIFITDISVSEKVAEEIDLAFNSGVPFQLVDHHGTALWLAEKYPSWCHVRVEESALYPKDFFANEQTERVKSSGTSLFYKFLRNKHLPSIVPNAQLKAFAETVRRYDTWDWHNVHKDDHPKQLNDLLYLIGRESFVERFVSSSFPTFTDTELKLLAVEQYRINKYIWNQKRKAKIMGLLVGGKSYRVAYVFAEQYSSLLGNAIAEELGEEIDFVMLIDMSNLKVSLRGIHDDIDLGRDVARHYGGGGHPKASGFELSERFSEMLFIQIASEGSGI